MVAGYTHFVKDRAAAVDSTVFAGRFGRLEVVVKVHDCVAMPRRIESTAEEEYTRWIQGVVDTAVAAMKLDKVLAQDFAPPAQAERICS